MNCEGCGKRFLILNLCEPCILQIFTIYNQLMYHVYLKMPTYFSGSVHHNQGVLLLYQSHIPVKVQSFSKYNSRVHSKWLCENEEILLRVKEERNKLCTRKRRKDSWIGLILFKNCLLKYVTEEKTDGRIEVTGRWGRRYKMILDDIKKH
jgi:hypothetical protein